MKVTVLSQKNQIFKHLEDKFNQRKKTNQFILLIKN